MPESNGSPPSLLPLLSPITCRNWLEQDTRGDWSKVRAPKEIQEFSAGMAQPQGGLAALHPQSFKGLCHPWGSANPPLSAEDDYNSKDNSKIIAITHPGNSESTSHGREEPASEAFSGVHEARNGPCSVSRSCVHCSCGQKCQYISAFWQQVFGNDQEIINELPPAGMCKQHKTSTREDHRQRLLPTTPSTMTDECELVDVTCLKALTLKMRHWV